MKVVVDTNVPVVANGKSKQASPECVRRCVVRLNEITKGGKFVLDDNWLILKEYMANLNSRGQPGAGDAYLKWVLSNHGNPKMCEKVQLTLKGTSEAGFEEFPANPELEGFDPDDKKFIAVAMAHPDKPPILQATDAEWWDLKDHFQVAGVTIDFLCEDDIRATCERRSPPA
jgi:hypothetical protein